MSIRIMSQVWGLKLPDSEMLILLALADWSNDDGDCWPSIAQLRAKTNKSERTIQGAIKSMVEAGHMSRDEVPGRGCNYRIHPRSDCTPAATAPRTKRTPAKSAPPQRTTDTPAAAADNTSVHIIPQKTSSSSVARASKPDVFPMPDWADPQVWADWMRVRKAKGATNTATAYKGFLEDIARFADAEWPPGRILEHAVRKNWRGIYDPREQDGRNGHRNAVVAVAGNRTGPTGLGGRTVSAAQRFASRG